MIQQILASLLIEAKQGTYDKVESIITQWVEAMKESQHEPGEDDESRAILRAKESMCWELLTEIQAAHESQIQEVKERYQCLEESNTSSGYFAHLPSGWTQNA